MDKRFGYYTPCEDVVKAFSSQVQDRTFAITGTSAGGLGASAAIALSRSQSAHIILISRNRSKCGPVISEINTHSPSTKVTFINCSLDDLDAVRSAAETILTDPGIDKIDILLNNAGVMAIPEYKPNKHGLEMTLASNHLGHFLLTNLLLPKILAAGPGARIINHSSKGHKIGPFRFEDYNFQNGTTYNPWSAYGQSKTANILFTVALARRLRSTGIKSYSCHPGSIYDTPLSAHLDPSFFHTDGVLSKAAVENTGRMYIEDQPKTVSQGTSTLLVAALDPGLEGVSGAWLVDCRVQTAVQLGGDGPFEGWVEDEAGCAHVEPVYAYAVDERAAERLWGLSEELVRERFGL